MKKQELRKYLRVYPRLEKALAEGKTVLEVVRRKKKRRIVMEPWVRKLPQMIREIMATEEEETVKELIRLSILQGREPQRVTGSLPLSERTYYRWKESFEEKLFRLLIFEREVGKEEILSEKISG